jgi:hypothetical protein
MTALSGGKEAKEKDEPFTPEGIAKVFINELRKILSDQKELDQAIKDRHILKEKSASLSSLDAMVPPQFDAKGNVSPEATFEFHEKARADNEKKLYLAETLSDRESIAFAAAFFAAAARTNAEFLPVVGAQMTRDKTIGDQLKAMVEAARFVVATELRDRVGFTDPQRGYTVKPEAEAHLEEIQKNIPNLISTYGTELLRHFQSCLNQIKVIEGDLIKKVTAAGGDVKDFKSAAEWVAVQKTTNPTLKGLSGMTQAAKDHASLKNFIDILTPGAEKPSSAEERVKNFYGALRQWRSEYKGSHGKAVSIFKMTPSPIYKVWLDAKPTVKAREVLEKQKFKEKKAP